MGQAFPVLWRASFIFLLPPRGFHFGGERGGGRELIRCSARFLSLKVTYRVAAYTVAYTIACPRKRVPEAASFAMSYCREREMFRYFIG